MRFVDLVICYRKLLRERIVCYNIKNVLGIMNGGIFVNILQSRYNTVFYYFSEKIVVLKIFEEIHMAKVIFVDSTKEKVVDISGISTVPVFDISVPITLLGGKER